ncbi:MULTISPECIES: hypothetical protein [unclassified Rhodanobacter]|uniref:hypothetical protein n=1 Tax=unclassified Rhodanobacter TaxID=2621553 RepID=UPI001BE062A9|nr:MULTISPECIES: hypothetical protein [unclassified Rhodanobacter]MBT2144851.1 hypothetical protein [Rhodanobacter sp. LX-99]MBT2148896.1 hypothetical protein [Rhodanobacter sp. LX-100]
MFDVIDFLESVGQDAQLRYASSEKVVATLAGQSIDFKFRDDKDGKDDADKDNSDKRAA